MSVRFVRKFVGTGLPSTPLKIHQRVLIENESSLVEGMERDDHQRFKKGRMYFSY